MGKLTVFSDSRMGATAATQASLADVHLYALRLIGAGHLNVRVGATKDDAVPYEQWRRANTANMPEEAAR